MLQPLHRRDADESSAERRTLILDAAERCFSCAGFHRTTMQDVAAEAGMSPGNLYRYFTSKDALVAGICERDRLELSRQFAELHGRVDFMQAFRALGQRHFQDSARDKARLCLEIWAEAARNPAIAALQTEFASAMHDQFVAAFEAAKINGGIHPSVDSRAVASIIGKLGDGLSVRRATATDFDADREVAEVFVVIGALMKGAIGLPSLSPDRCDGVPASPAEPGSRP